MLVDKTEFEAWMERIMGELYRISRKLDKAETREKHLNYLNGERLYDNQEVCLLLRISKRTLQRYRNNGVLKFYSIYHKTYYKESDLHEFIRNNFDDLEGECSDFSFFSKRTLVPFQVKYNVVFHR